MTYIAGYNLLGYLPTRSPPSSTRSTTRATTSLKNCATARSRKTATRRRSIVTARVWTDRSRNASTVYASLWVMVGDDPTSGHGSAGGGGYHKNSAALCEAVQSAGIKLQHTRPDRRGERAYINGVGDRAMEHALLAIARAAGCRSKHILLVKA